MARYTIYDGNGNKVGSTNDPQEAYNIAQNSPDSGTLEVVARGLINRIRYDRARERER